MKEIISLVFLILIFGCNNKNLNTKEHINNQELIKMIEVDQKMRQEDTTDFELIDQKHRKRVFELLAENQIKTPIDKYNAALILQHTNAIYCDNMLKSISPENFLLAYCLSNSAYNEGYKQAAYMVALNQDRYLLYTLGYQKYGTQKIYDEKSDSFLWAPIDSTTTDVERAKYGVPNKKVLLEQALMKNF
tara:strand:+ start:4921 stop:5490 length:570 start_codon:yes stop_codon:yes gene_type:complete